MATATFTKVVIKQGTGEPVQTGRSITVHALGQQLVDGKKVKFWSTKDPGQKAFTYQAGMGKVIRGWDDGCMTMRVGETAELTIPGKYGYPDGLSAWSIARNATLVFEIEILSQK
ncbi:MAG: FKBP-type peptidyl-prolyl cis-trans isomerase [Myxococcales bacterium]|nr:FKBP-type peptidyl-prolyl cis-trans isomerase [Myxococcales bacterium]